MSSPNPGALPDGSKAKLSVIEGVRKGKTYSLKDGVSYIGRLGPMQIDVDLTEQENPGVAVKVNRFALIWLALLLYAADGVRTARLNCAAVRA